MLAVILQTSEIYFTNLLTDPQIHEQMEIIQRKLSIFEGHKAKSSLNIEVQTDLIHNLF
mgnify:CR=1 FL=1